MSPASAGASAGTSTSASAGASTSASASAGASTSDSAAGAGAASDSRPRVVAVGGGHGLAATIRAVRHYAGHATAIVSVADDGGSSGRLRDALGIAPPGDIRRCLVAMGDPDSMWGKAFEHRFGGGELEGHAVGNLVIAGLAAATGDFLAALDEAGRLLGATGPVLPATTTPVQLQAEGEDGPIAGQVKVAKTGRIRRVSIVPGDVQPPPAALEALAGADQVVLGPGSLFTSVLAALAVPALKQAVGASPGRRVYVCNLGPQEAETAGFDAAAHVEALLDHGVEIDAVLCDPRFVPTRPLPVPVHHRELADPDSRAHDPARLAGALADLLG